MSHNAALWDLIHQAAGDKGSPDAADVVADVFEQEGKAAHSNTWREHAGKLRGNPRIHIYRYDSSDPIRQGRGTYVFSTFQAKNLKQAVKLAREEFGHKHAGWKYTAHYDTLNDRKKSLYRYGRKKGYK